MNKTPTREKKATRQATDYTIVLYVVCPTTEGTEAIENAVRSFQGDHPPWIDLATTLAGYKDYVG